MVILGAEKCLVHSAAHKFIDKQAVQHMPQRIRLRLHPEPVVFLHMCADGEGSGFTGADDDFVPNFTPVAPCWSQVETATLNQCLNPLLLFPCQQEPQNLGAPWRALNLERKNLCALLRVGVGVTLRPS